MKRYFCSRKSHSQPTHPSSIPANTYISLLSCQVTLRNIRHVFLASLPYYFLCCYYAERLRLFIVIKTNTDIF